MYIIIFVFCLLEEFTLQKSVRNKLQLFHQHRLKVADQHCYSLISKEEKMAWSCLLSMRDWSAQSTLTTHHC